jgi:hypothetical protein
VISPHATGHAITEDGSGLRVDVMADQRVATRYNVKPSPTSRLGDHFAYAYDLTLDETRRRTAVLEAIGDWDPIQVFAEEERAWDMLYGGLDGDQQRIYDELVSAGVLPDRAMNRVAD